MLGITINGELVFGEKSLVNFRIYDEKLQILDTIAKKCDLSRSQIINLCIDYALSQEKFIMQFDVKNVDIEKFD